MVAMRVVFILLTSLIGMFIVIALFLTLAKDVFPWLFQDKNINLAATRGTIELGCNGDVHTFSVTELGIAYSGTKEKQGFLVLIWGNKVAASADDAVTFYPEGEGDNVYTYYINFHFDSDANPDDNVHPYTPPGQEKSELILAFFEKDEYCHELATRENSPGNIVNGLVKYSTDYVDFVNQCSSKLKGLGIVKTKAVMIGCEAPNNVVDLSLINNPNGG